MRKTPNTRSCSFMSHSIIILFQIDDGSAGLWMQYLLWTLVYVDWFRTGETRFAIPAHLLYSIITNRLHIIASLTPFSRKLTNDWIGLFAWPRSTHLQSFIRITLKLFKLSCQQLHTPTHANTTKNITSFSKVMFLLDVPWRYSMHLNTTFNLKKLFGLSIKHFTANLIHKATFFFSCCCWKYFLTLYGKTVRSEQFSQCDLLFVQQQLCCTFGHKIAPKGVSPGLMISAAASASNNDSMCCRCVT